MARDGIPPVWRGPSLAAANTDPKRNRSLSAIKVPVYVIPGETIKEYLNQYTDSLKNMFQEAIRVHQNFCTYSRWPTTEVSGPFSELKSGFLTYRA